MSQKASSGTRLHVLSALPPQVDDRSDRISPLQTRITCQASGQQLSTLCQFGHKPSVEGKLEITQN